MANYRQIHVTIWKDTWVIDLDPDEKLLFIYLFSNELTTVAGIYKISKRVIAFETGLSHDFVDAALRKFQDAGKVYYSGDVLWVKNLRKYNANASPKVEKRIESELDDIPNDNPIKAQYIRYYYGMDMASYINSNSNSNNNIAGTEHQQNPVAVVTAAYEQNIGAITPMISDEIIDLCDTYPLDWIKYAIGASVKNEKRSMAYINGVLKRLQREGFNKDKGNNGKFDLSTAEGIDAFLESEGLA